MVKKQTESYKEFLKEDKFLKNIIQDILPDVASDMEKVIALYDYGRNNVETTFRGYTHAEKKPSQVVKESKGNEAEKNILLVNLLKTAGFDAHPLLISTPSNAMNVSQISPSQYAKYTTFLTDVAKNDNDGMFVFKK